MENQITKRFTIELVLIDNETDTTYRESKQFNNYWNIKHEIDMLSKYIISDHKTETIINWEKNKEEKEIKKNEEMVIEYL